MSEKPDPKTVIEFDEDLKEKPYEKIPGIAWALFIGLFLFLIYYLVYYLANPPTQP